MSELFNERDWVRLKEGQETARIVGFLSDVEGGVVLDRRLDGFRCWNVEALERVADQP